MPVPQYINMLPTQCLRDRIRVHAKIMIAQNSVNPMACAQAAQYFSCRADIPARIGDEIACQSNDVGIQPVRLLHRIGKPFFGEKQAVVNVRNLNYAQAAKRTRKCVQPNAFLVHSETLAANAIVRLL